MSFTRRTFLGNVIATGAVGLLSGGLAPSVASMASAEGDVAPEERAAMAGLAEDFRKKWNVPGLSVAIARDGCMQYQRAFGFTDHSAGEPLEVSNLFRIASISKPITSVAVFQLMEQGRLRPDTRVFGEGAILGTQYGNRPYGANLKSITVDHLLTHTAGGWGKHNDPMFSNVSMSQAELISWALDNKPLEHQPGTVFDYSNFGFCLLGRVIEKVSGQPYARFMQENVLVPSGIMDMHIAANTRNARYPKEVTYFGQNGEDPYALNVTRMDSHGGWIANPMDLLRFTHQITGGAGGPALLKPETVRAMTTLSIEPGRARGWFISGSGHWWHSGDLAGTSAILVRLTSGLCWAALVNTRSDSTDVQLDNFVWSLIKQVKAWRFALN